MNERPRAPEIRGAGLADGLKTVAPDTGGLPRGGTPGQAQSEREKRGSRHSDDHVSQVALDDLGLVTPPDRPKRRLGSGQQDRGGMGTDLGTLAGAGRPMPSAQALSNQQTYQNQNSRTGK